MNGKQAALNELKELTGARDLRELCEFFGLSDASEFWTPIKEEQAAKILGLSVPTLRNYRHLSKPPRFIKNGTAVSYLPLDLHLHNLRNAVVMGEEAA